MTTIAPLPADVRLTIEVYLDHGERYDVRMPDLDTPTREAYGEVRLVRFYPGEPTAMIYAARRRLSGLVNAAAVPTTVPLDDVPAHIRQAALVRLKTATALL